MDGFWEDTQEAYGYTTTKSETETNSKKTDIVENSIKDDENHQIIEIETNIINNNSSELNYKDNNSNSQNPELTSVAQKVSQSFQNTMQDMTDQMTYSMGQMEERIHTTLETAHSKQVHFSEITSRNNRFLDDLNRDDHKFRLWFKDLRAAEDIQRYALGDSNEYKQLEFSNLDTEKGLLTALMKIFDLDFNGVVREIESVKPKKKENESTQKEDESNQKEDTFMQKEITYKLSGFDEGKRIVFANIKPEVSELVGFDAKLDSLYSHQNRVQEDADANNLLKFTFEGQIEFLKKIGIQNDAYKLKNFKQIMLAFTGNPEAGITDSPLTKFDKVRYGTRKLLQMSPVIGNKVSDWQRNLSKSEKVELVNKTYNQRLSQLNNSIAKRIDSCKVILNESTRDKSKILESIVEDLCENSATGEKNLAAEFIDTSIKNMLDQAQKEGQYFKVTEAQRNLFSDEKDEETWSPTYNQDVLTAKTYFGIWTRKNVEAIQGSLEKNLEAVKDVYSSIHEMQRDLGIQSTIVQENKSTKSSNFRWRAGAVGVGIAALSLLGYVSQKQIVNAREYIIAAIDESLTFEDDKTLEDKFREINKKQSETKDALKEAQQNQINEINSIRNEYENNQVSAEDIFEQIENRRRADAQAAKQRQKYESHIASIRREFDSCTLDQPVDYCKKQPQFSDLFKPTEATKTATIEPVIAQSAPIMTTGIIFGTDSGNAPGLSCYGSANAINLYDCKPVNAAASAYDSLKNKLGSNDSFKKVNLDIAKKSSVFGKTLKTVIKPFEYIKLESKE